MNLLIILAIVLGIIALSKVVKVLEQASFAKGENTYEPNAKENKMQALLMPLFLIAYFAFVAWQVIAWGDRMLPIAASEHGLIVDQLMNTTWIIIIPVFIGTHILLF